DRIARPPPDCARPEPAPGPSRSARAPRRSACERCPMTMLRPIVTVAQVFEPSMPSVAPTPFIERWVTGSGLPGAGLLLGLAVLALVALPRAGRARQAWPVAAALAAAGLGVLAVGQLVVTDREALRAQARDLVDAAVNADRDALRVLLHPDARVR